MKWTNNVFFLFDWNLLCSAVQYRGREGQRVNVGPATFETGFTATVGSSNNVIVHSSCVYRMKLVVRRVQVVIGQAFNELNGLLRMNEHCLMWLDSESKNLRGPLAARDCKSVIRKYRISGFCQYQISRSVMKYWVSKANIAVNEVTIWRPHDLCMTADRRHHRFSDRYNCHLSSKSFINQFIIVLRTVISHTPTNSASLQFELRSLKMTAAHGSH